jgi:hypothetical protein
MEGNAGDPPAGNPPDAHVAPGIQSTVDIVLWLDLAAANQMEEPTVRAYTPPGATLLKLTDHGAKTCHEGTPARWRPVLDALDRLVRHARRLEKPSSGCRYWVTGRAGLPAFLYLGHRLSKFAAVTFVHQPLNSALVSVMPLDRSTSGAEMPPYFERTPWPVPHTDITAPAAIVVSSEWRPPEHQILDALAERKTRAAGIVYAHAPARFGASSVPSAMNELTELIRVTCDAHPARSALAVFVRGPSTLAFLVGRAINRRVCRDAQMFEFDGKGYSLAYELPYPPVPDRNKVLFFAASPAGTPQLDLEDEIRAIQLERSPGTLADRLEIVNIPAARAQDLGMLRTHEPGAVQFSGHGESGELLFQDDRGESRPLPTSDLAETFRLAGSSVRLVVLSACHSESHVEALLAHVECVVAMRGPVHDDDARRFTVAFYRHLALGDSVQDAFDNGILEMRLHRPAAATGSRTRDIEVPGAELRASGEPPQLCERDPGCASEVFLVRRRPR